MIVKQPKTMDTEESRKRPATSEYASSVKRLCQESVNSSSNESPQSNDSPLLSIGQNAYIPSLFSVKQMLTVPLEYIFRRCAPATQQHRASHSQTPTSTSHYQQPAAAAAAAAKPLLSRNEASCLIRIQTLAAEMDSLVQLSAYVLSEQVEWMTFHDEIARSNIRPLRAFLPLLLTLGQTFVHRRLQSLQADLTEVLKELEILGENLHQSSEANWSTSEALLDVGVTNAMAVEKRHLSDIQDELAQRIDNLVQTTIIDGEQEISDDQGDTWDSASSQSMADFCHQVWRQNVQQSSVLSPRPSSSQNSRLSVEPAGKENEPSQHSTNSAVIEDSPALCPGAASQNAALALSSLAFSAASPSTSF